MQYVYSHRYSLQSVLKGLQVRDDVADLTWIEPELGHCRMACDDPLREGFLEVVDRVALVESTEWRCDLQWTLTDFADRVTA